MSGTLGDFIAKDVITIALVSEGNETLEDLGIECLTPGQTIIKCLDARAVKPVEQANAYIAERDDCSVEWILREYASGKLLRDVDRDCDVEIAVTDMKERIGQLEDELRATKRELKLINGQLTTTLNNWEQAKGKLERQRIELSERSRKLDERDAQTADERAKANVDYWKRQAEKAREEAEKWRSAFGEILDACHEVHRIAAFMEPGLGDR